MYLNIARGLTVLNGLFLIFIGSRILMDPGGLRSLPNLSSPEEFGMIRLLGSFYIGTALIGLLSVTSRERLPYGIQGMLILTSCLVLARILGITLDGSTANQMTLLYEELIFPVMAILGLIFERLSRRQDSVSPAA